MLTSGSWKYTFIKVIVRQSNFRSVMKFWIVSFVIFDTFSRFAIAFSTNSIDKFFSMIYDIFFCFMKNIQIQILGIFYQTPLGCDG